ncbi:MAG TPA: hypothetical protein VH912_32395 [Streptosporangiaceae bacterium]|jgi:hypothetical protein
MYSWQYLAYLAIKKDLSDRDDGFLPVIPARSGRRPGRRRGRRAVAES